MQKLLTKEDVVALARLASLDLDSKQITKYQKELSAILDYMKLLNTVDVSGLKPTSQVTGLENVTRNDIVKEQPATPKKLLDGTPSNKDGYIQVKRML